MCCALGVGVVRQASPIDLGLSPSKMLVLSRGIYEDCHYCTLEDRNDQEVC